MTGLLVAVLLALVGPAAPAAAAADSSFGDSVSVTIDRSEVATTIGQHFSFSTSVHNEGNQPRSGLIAHLNVLSVDPGVYVDPEDWSPQRTMYLGPVPAHGSVVLRWRVQAVNDGRFVIYVAVTTRHITTGHFTMRHVTRRHSTTRHSTTLHGPAPVVVSDGLRLSAAAQRTINAGGVLPVVIAVPGALLALILLNAQRRRRLR